MTDNHQTDTTPTPPLTKEDVQALTKVVQQLTHVVGLAVVALDRHARVTDRRLAAQAAEAVDGIVVVQRMPDGTQKVIVRDTATATQAVAKQVEAAQARDTDGWSEF